MSVQLFRQRSVLCFDAISKDKIQAALTAGGVYNFICSCKTVNKVIYWDMEELARPEQKDRFILQVLWRGFATNKKRDKLPSL